MAGTLASSRDVAATTAIRIRANSHRRPAANRAAGNKPKLIGEFVGRINNGERLSIATMRSPAGWVEPGQRPERDEFAVVLLGVLRVRHACGFSTREAVVTRAGEWVQYTTPGPDGAEYMAACLPAFSPQTVRRDPD